MYGALAPYLAESKFLDSAIFAFGKNQQDSRILDSSFLKILSLVKNSKFYIAKEKGGYPLLAPLNPEKDKASAVFCFASLATRWVFFGNQGESLAFPFQVGASRMHYCILISMLPHHEAGELKGVSHGII